MAFTFGRIALDSPLEWTEQMGDPVTNTGGAPVPAIRTALRHSVSVPTFSSPAAEDTVEKRLRARRQLRSLLNNTLYKMLGVYLVWDDDPEQNGWYLPDQGQLAAGADAPLTHGYFKLENFVWFKVGAQRTHRAASGLSLKDRRGGLWARDTLRRIYNTDFGSLSALSLTYLHANVTDTQNTVSLAVTPTITLPRGADGGATQIAVGQTDLQVISYELPETSRNLGNVIVYDRRGNLGAQTNGVVNPSFEYDAIGTAPAGWANNTEANITSTTFAVQSGWSVAGFRALRCTGTHAANTTSAGIGPVTANARASFAPVTAGEQITVGYTVNILSAASEGFRVEVTWMRSNLTVISTSSGALSEAGATGIRTLSSQFTAPAEAAYARITIRGFSNTNGATIDFYLDKIYVGREYVDGDTPGYTWSGASGNSTTILAAWEEIYGPDYPYSWTTGSPLDVPVLENGRCRIRYDSSNKPGFKVDAWTGTAWQEQGKIIIQRRSAETEYDNQLLSATVVEYTPARAVIRAVMKAGILDANSREEVFITLQEGWSGPLVEVYPATNANGEAVGAQIQFTLVSTDSDVSAAKIDRGGGIIRATATGTGHTGNFVEEQLGESSFTAENEVMLGRWGNTPFGVNAAVVQAAVAAWVTSGSVTYGSVRNAIQIRAGLSSHLGYVAARFGFPELHADQAMEAENMTLSSGTSSTADAEASNGTAATSTRTADAAHVTRGNWPNSNQATYRIFARVRTTASTLNIYAKNGGSGESTRTSTTTSTTYVWLDLGTLITTNAILEIHAWATAAATIFVDRIEAFLLEDRNTAQGGIYEGGRDLGQSVLIDSRITPTVVTRN